MMDDDYTNEEKLRLNQELDDKIMTAITEKTKEKIEEVTKIEEDWEIENIEKYWEITNIDSTCGINSSDVQTAAFSRFVSIATSFASLSYAQRLAKIPDIVKEVATLLNAMKEEVKEFAEVAKQVSNITLTFQTTAENIRTSVAQAIPHLSGVRHQMAVVEDVFNKDSEIEATDKVDVSESLALIQSGLDSYLSFAREAIFETKTVMKSLTKINEEVLSHQLVVKQRLDFSSFFATGGVLMGSLTTGLGAILSIDLAVKSSTLGGSGMLVVAGFTVPPIAGIIASTVFGAAIVCSVIGVVKHLWDTHNTKALGYLEQILTLLHQLSRACLYINTLVNYSVEKAQGLHAHTKQIVLCLSSERQRRINGHVAKQTVNVLDEMLKSMEVIAQLKIESLVNLKSPSTINQKIK